MGAPVNRFHGGRLRKTHRRVVLDVVDPRIVVVIFRALSRLAGSGLPGESRRGS
jgi:hypothetical protein